MNAVSILILAFPLGMLLHYTFFYDYGKAYLSAMYHPGEPSTYKEFLIRLINRIVGWLTNKLGKEAIDKLEKVGTEPREYIMWLLGAPIGGFVAGSLLGVSFYFVFKLPSAAIWVLGLLMAFVGYVIVRVSLVILWDNYNRELKHGLPELINNLKSNIIAGDTMEQAFRSAAEFAWGPVKKMVMLIIRLSEGEMSFSEALEWVINRTEDTDILSVLQQIKNYHLSGIPDRSQVFADMAEDMMRISVDHNENMLEMLEVHMTFLLMGGMAGDVLRIGIPVALMAFKKLMNS